MPERVQLRRVGGWRMPTGAVKVDRTTPFGNPFRAEDHGQGEAVDLFAALLAQVDRRYLRHGEPTSYPGDGLLLTALAGRDLACWCGLDRPCHADVLLAYVEALGEPFTEEPEGPAWAT